MAKFTLEGREYDLDAISAVAKERVVSIQFCDAELQRIQAEFNAIQAAKAAYVRALKEELSALVEKGYLGKGEDKTLAEIKPTKKNKGFMSFFTRKND